MKILIFFLAVLVSIVGAYEIYTRERTDVYVSAAYIAEGLQVAAQAKHAIMDFYQSEGEFPSSNSEIGLSDPSNYASRSLQRLDVKEGGIINLTFTALTGIDGGKLLLKPNGANPEIGIQWSCVTPTYKHIAELIPQCRYLP